VPTRDPICTHRAIPAGRVAWPTGMPEHGERHASTYVCARTACIEDAREWVREITGTRGVLVPFERPQAPFGAWHAPQMTLFESIPEADRG
jgi:hypothetical protein